MKGLGKGIVLFLAVTTCFGGEQRQERVAVQPAEGVVKKPLLENPGTFKGRERRLQRSDVCIPNTIVASSCCSNACGLDCENDGDPLTTACVLIGSRGCACTCGFGWDLDKKCCSAACDLDCGETKQCGLGQDKCYCTVPTETCTHLDDPIEKTVFPPNGRFTGLDGTELLKYMTFVGDLCNSSNPSRVLPSGLECGEFFGADKPNGTILIGNAVFIENWYPNRETPRLHFQFLPIFGDSSEAIQVVFSMKSGEDIVIQEYPYKDRVICRDIAWNSVSLDLTPGIEALEQRPAHSFSNIVIQVKSSGLAGFDNIEITGPSQGSKPKVPKVELEPLEERFQLPNVLFFAIPSPFLVVFLAISVWFCVSRRPMSKSMIQTIQVTIYVWQVIAVLLLAYSAYELLTLNDTLEELQEKETLRSYRQAVLNLEYHHLVVKESSEDIGGGVDNVLPFMPKSTWIKYFEVQTRKCEDLGADSDRCVKSVDDLTFEGLQWINTVAIVNQKKIQHSLFGSFAVDVLSGFITVFLIKFNIGAKAVRAFDLLVVLVSTALVVYIAYLAYVDPLSVDIVGTMVETNIDAGKEAFSKVASVKLIDHTKVTLDQYTGNFVADLAGGTSFQRCWGDQTSIENILFLLRVYSFNDLYCITENQMKVESTCVQHACKVEAPMTVAYKVDYEKRQELIEETIIYGVVYVDILLTSIDVVLLFIVHVVLRASKKTSQRKPANVVVVPREV